jgi:hypothetical protein
MLALVMGGGLGAAVLFAGEAQEGPPGANFSYQFFDRNGNLIVTHKEGDELQAGNIRIRSGGSNVTWATVAGDNNSTMVSQGDTIQLSPDNEFGRPITSSTTVFIEWTGGNETRRLSRWPVNESGGGAGLS